MYKLIAGTCLISPILWFVSVRLTQNWKHFKTLVVVDSILLLLYISIFNLTDWIDIGHDEYGLKILTINILLIVGHVIIGFISSIVINSSLAP